MEHFARFEPIQQHHSKRWTMVMGEMAPTVDADDGWYGTKHGQIRQGNTRPCRGNSVAMRYRPYAASVMLTLVLLVLGNVLVGILDLWNEQPKLTGQWNRVGRGQSSLKRDQQVAFAHRPLRPRQARTHLEEKLDTLNWGHNGLGDTASDCTYAQSR